MLLPREAVKEWKVEAMRDEFMSPKEVADLVKVIPQTVLRGPLRALPWHRLSARCFRVRRSAVEAFIADR